MRNIDFSSFQGAIFTLLGLAVVTLTGVGLRLLLMTTVQQRRERMNRQINERLRILIAAYKTLGGSFTGDLSVNPFHLRSLAKEAAARGDANVIASTERSRRMRDAVEGAISDILLLGNEYQVRLADKAARDLVAGRAIQTQELVVSLREFIREALDLDPLPAGIAIPPQGPSRAVQTGGKDKGGKIEGDGGGKGNRDGLNAGLGGSGLSSSAGSDFGANDIQHHED